MSNSSLHESNGRPSSPIVVAAVAEVTLSPGELERGGSGASDLHVRKSKKNTLSRPKPSPSPTNVPPPQNHNALIKYGSLLLLVGQMVGLVLLMRYSRTHTDGELYLASTAVFMMEVSWTNRPCSCTNNESHSCVSMYHQYYTQSLIYLTHLIT